MFSIIIPLYNKELNIGVTLQSVISQTYNDFEILIVNDGSTDESVAIVKTFMDTRIRIIQKENGGVSSARNSGIKEAKFNYIAFLDADDVWEPNYLEEMRNLVLSYPKAAILGCNFDYYENGKYKQRDNGLPSDFRNIVTNYFEIGKRFSLFWTSAVIVQKEKVEEVGCFDERISMGEDLDLWFRMVLNFQSAVFYNIVLAHYNLNDPSSAMKKKHDYHKSILCYLDKYSYWESENIEFSEFINLFKCRKFVELFNNYDIDKNIIKNYTRRINTSVVSNKWKFYCQLPYSCKKRIAINYKMK